MTTLIREVNTGTKTFKLGDTIRDTISGFEGVMVCYTVWLNGCIRLTIQPRQLHDGKPVDNQTFDIEQCELNLGKNQWRSHVDPSGGDRPTIRRATDPR